MLGGCFHLGFSGFWDHPHPPSIGGGSGTQRIPNCEKLEYCKTIKIIFYNFVNLNKIVWWCLAAYSKPK